MKRFSHKMDKSVTCEHLNKLVEVLGNDLWQTKETLECFDCGCPGPNLWMCLQPDCHHVGCSEVKNDHSTLHQKTFPQHCVHMNVSTERIWCYHCEREVHARAAIAYSRMSPDTTSLGGASTSHLGIDHSVAFNVSIEDDEDKEESQDQERARGLVGLQNIGNTCYMNAALQALSHTAPLTNYFLECAPAVAVLAQDKRPGLSRTYQKLIREMWNRKTRGYVVPNGILYGIRNVHPMFRGYQQHDAQEFLRCFMDQLHEELKETVFDNAPEDKLNSEADGDHNDARAAHVRRRAASSGASDAPYFARMRRKSPAPSTYSDTRNDGYLRVHSTSECGNSTRGGPRHRRSASFAGTNHSLTTAVYHATADSTQRDFGSESELSCSSETEDKYETCSSGASDAPEPRSSVSRAGTGAGGDAGVRYRSVISDVFDGRLMSTVQCLICDRVSTRVETFQDLSLPIPSRDHLAVLRAQQPPPHHDQDSWMWWLVSWLRSWFYGPVVSLQDCLAAFFSADELKGDNMYSCSRCNKLRNGVKLSVAVRLPEVLSVHLKRFRHELMFSCKVAARVAFPLRDLDMSPYTHPECTSKITRYNLCAVICHAGTAGGGHYTCIARNNREWYQFDDTSVTRVTPHHVASAEAYVLFYRKVNPAMTALRQKAAEIFEAASDNSDDIKFYISKQWINKFNTWAEPGPIDNSDFVCQHGGVRPERAQHVAQLCARAPQPLWELLHDTFGGGPACTHLHECGACARAADTLRRRRDAELATFYDLHAAFQEQDRPHAIYAISMHWFRQWQAFVRDKTPRPPPPVDNSGILSKQDIDGVPTFVLKPGSDHAQLSEELWRFFTDIYGGGPEVKLRAPHANHTHAQPVDTPTTRQRHARKYSESDKEDYCAKSTSEVNIRDTVHGEIAKNQSLQNINRRYDEETNYKYLKHEPNGNFDSDEDLGVHNHKNTIRMENGVDSSDHDANENPVGSTQEDLPNLDSISLKNKPKSGKVREHRRTRRRTVK